MNIDKMKSQHVEILEKISFLRKLSQAGVSSNAQEIATAIVSMSAIIKTHLSAEDQFLYPHIEQDGNSKLRQVSSKFQREMTDIVSDYDVFSRRWNIASKLIGNDEAFRRDANTVLRKVFERMQKENKDFYPLVERM
ncbi:hemerythrin domain-containing protein [Citrobacter portucalensis]|uniref:hemerythrin domain-containing protein n=1 Tax=Citrobacter TaxID=544 RepID=UPI000F6EAD92|nr:MULTISPECIES: hemerythrin domain-containing protein [Citrobacter]MBA8328876.1 hemerythrin domain-containing protein [Citrobacter freundii]NCB58736.1 hemerythrin domain-containing protein [Gammaproteobacteria bacterium]KAA0540169.1 hemerythrin domain-containing protein [Citrobacter portucalensis]MBA8332982.1 hemerythrin domain-containing protein [Citrobacter freundii]MDM2756733.1 hemerythrin domain-containing protein [Citrobacter sp. Cpo221]